MTYSSKYLHSTSNHLCKLLILNVMAPRHGFEPRFTAPKAAVLPLDDRGLAKGLLLQCTRRLPFAATCSRPTRPTHRMPLQCKTEGNLDWCSGRSSKPFGGHSSRWCVRFALSSAIPTRLIT